MELRIAMKGDTDMSQLDLESERVLLAKHTYWPD